MSNNLLKRKEELENELKTLTIRINIESSFGDYPKGFIDSMYSKIKKEDGNYLQTSFENIEGDEEMQEYINEHWSVLFGIGVFDNYIKLAVGYLTYDDIIEYELDMHEFFQRYGEEGIRIFSEKFNSDLINGDEANNSFLYNYRDYNNDWKESMDVLYCYREDYINDISEFLKENNEYISNVIENLDYSEENEVELFDDLKNDGLLNDLSNNEIKVIYELIFNEKSATWNDNDLTEYIKENLYSILDYYTKSELFDIII